MLSLVPHKYKHEPLMGASYTIKGVIYKKKGAPFRLLNLFCSWRGAQVSSGINPSGFFFLVKKNIFGRFGIVTRLIRSRLLLYSLLPSSSFVCYLIEGSMFILFSLSPARSTFSLTTYYIIHRPSSASIYPHLFFFWGSPYKHNCFIYAFL